MAEKTQFVYLSIAHLAKMNGNDMATEQLKKWLFSICLGGGVLLIGTEGLVLVMVGQQILKSLIMKIHLVDFYQPLIAGLLLVFWLMVICGHWLLNRSCLLLSRRQRKWGTLTRWYGCVWTMSLGWFVMHWSMYVLLDDHLELWGFLSHDWLLNAVGLVMYGILLSAPIMFWMNLVRVRHLMDVMRLKVSWLKGVTGVLLIAVHVLIGYLAVKHVQYDAGVFLVLLILFLIILVHAFSVVILISLTNRAFQLNKRFDEMMRWYQAMVAISSDVSSHRYK